MISEITYLSALLAGMISFLTPCVLPLVPPYLCYMAGMSLDQLTARDGQLGAMRARVMAGAVAFVLGFTTVFVALGAGASTIGQLVRAHLDTLSIIAGLVIIAMGLHFLGILRIGLLYREARVQTSGVGLAGSYVMGLAFAFGWTPCIGPVLGVILALAGTSDTVGAGAALLAVYSAGLGIPFLLAAFFVGPFMNWLSGFRRHLHRVEQIMGGLLVGTGILFITGGMQTFSFWLLEMFPALGNLG